MRALWSVLLLAACGAPPAAAPAVIGNRPAPATVAGPAAGGSCPAGMTYVEGGHAFRMGSTEDDHGADSDELIEGGGERWVTLSSFCIDRAEVTVDAYTTCVADGGCSEAGARAEWAGLTGAEEAFMSSYCNGHRGDRLDHPVNCVDWEQADAYCRWAAKALPTEAQWEYVARVRPRRGEVVMVTYPWGDDEPTPAHLNACGGECEQASTAAGSGLEALHGDDDGFVGTAPIGRFPLGDALLGPGDGGRVEDLGGNVREWTADWYAPYEAGSFRDPVAPRVKEQRTVRGGSWRNGDPDWLRGAFRYWYDPTILDPVVGFRCASPPL